MKWTNRDQAVWEEIENYIHSLESIRSNDFKDTYIQWVDQAISFIPKHLSDIFFEKLDSWLFHLHSFIQASQIQEDARIRILTSARVFDESIQTIADMRKLSIDQLSFIADQHSARHRLYALAQGGMTGTGKSILLSTDFLVLMMFNLRSVQITAISYGYDVKTPLELMISLKVFHAATLPKRLRREAWEGIVIDLQEDPYFYQGPENLLSYQWLEEPFKQILKTYFITMFKSKPSIIPIAIGAGLNYQFSRKVTDFADKFYKYRYLLDKG